MMMEAIVSHRPLDLLEPLAGLQGAFACSPGALSSWAIGAAPGRRCVYARAQRLSGALAERARLLARGGSIQINQTRCTIDRSLFDFLATRTAQPIVAKPVAVERLPAVAGDVFDLLERAADRGMSCPTNPQIGAALGGVSSRHVSHAIVTLANSGLISVEVQRTGDDGKRTIRILGTGQILCAG